MQEEFPSIQSVGVMLTPSGLMQLERHGCLPAFLIAWRVITLATIGIAAAIGVLSLLYYPVVALCSAPILVIGVVLFIVMEIVARRYRETAAALDPPVVSMSHTPVRAGETVGFAYTIAARQRVAIKQVSAKVLWNKGTEVSKRKYDSENGWQTISETDWVRTSVAQQRRPGATLTEGQQITGSMQCHLPASARRTATSATAQLYWCLRLSIPLSGHLIPYVEEYRFTVV
jgi:hypothetical protein